MHGRIMPGMLQPHVQLGRRGPQRQLGEPQRQLGGLQRQLRDSQEQEGFRGSWLGLTSSWRALHQAGRVLQPAGKPSKRAGRSSETAGRLSEGRGGGQQKIKRITVKISVVAADQKVGYSCSYIFRLFKIMQKMIFYQGDNTDLKTSG